MNMRYYGGHVSSAGGLANAIKNATQLNINTIQIHPTAPQRWITKDIPQTEVEALVSEQKGSPVKLVFAHAIYLINLAQPDKQKFHLGKMAVVSYLNFMHALEVEAEKQQSDVIAGGIVVHVGSAIHYPNKNDALDRVLYGINWILENSKGGNLILESSAGAGAVIGSALEDLVWLKSRAEQKERVHIGLDTQHMFASGYDWRNPTEVITSLGNILPLDTVKIIHLNDSKAPFNSKKDRHENLGEGEIGANALKQVVQAKELQSIPVVLETPRMKSIDEAKIDIEVLRSWVEG